MSSWLILDRSSTHVLSMLLWNLPKCGRIQRLVPIESVVPVRRVPGRPVPGHRRPDFVHHLSFGQILLRLCSLSPQRRLSPGHFFRCRRVNLQQMCSWARAAACGTGQLLAMPSRPVLLGRCRLLCPDASRQVLLAPLRVVTSPASDTSSDLSTDSRLLHALVE